MAPKAKDEAELGRAGKKMSPKKIPKVDPHIKPEDISDSEENDNKASRKITKAPKVMSEVQPPVKPEDISDYEEADNKMPSKKKAVKKNQKEPAPMIQHTRETTVSEHGGDTTEAPDPPRAPSNIKWNNAVRSTLWAYPKFTSPAFP